MRSLLTVTAAATQANRRLCTLAAVKAELGIAVTTFDAALTALIDEASSAIASHCKRTLAEESVSEVRRDVCLGPDDPLILARRPVTAIASVVVDGATLDSDEYEVDGIKAFLWRLSDDRHTRWSAEKITVAYTAGYRVPDQTDATLPYDIARAAVLTVSAWRHAEGRDPLLRSEAEEGVGASSWVAAADTRAIPPQAESLLAEHSREPRI